MSYVTTSFCLQHKPEPCKDADESDLQSAIVDAEAQVDAFLKELGVEVVPLTSPDITTEFKKAVAIWVAAVIYYDNNNVESGDRWRHLAETFIRRFANTHDFTNTEVTPPSQPAVTNWSDDITDWQEPRDV